MKEIASTLTAAQQDYLETIYRMERANNVDNVRVTDIAAELGTRLPTVTRTVTKLTQLGLLRHDHRQEVDLTAAGRKIAQDVVHRHDDLVCFFTDILGLSPKLAEIDACQIEHGISAKTAQRLHEFIEYMRTLSEEERTIITGFQKTASRGESDFKNLPAKKVSGWRS
ncbi:MAG: metal-dependent transcriptional regulator [candidate division Zixibacteria bacterium]|nr:metal-dependent transcriptional regulator [candidate division Zixibacteria bacterium]